MRTEAEIDRDAVEQRAFSNGSEYDYWAGSGRGCYDCVHDDWDRPGSEGKYCPILTVSLMGKWPTEWTRNRREFTTVDGEPSYYEYVGECTEFLRRPDDDGGDGDEPEPDPGPPPVAEGQLDIFTVFADQIIDAVELHPTPAATGRT
jgi:hypothetical protein